MLEPQCLALLCTRYQGLYHAVSSETWEVHLKRSLSDLVVDFSGSLLLQDRVAEHSEDVVCD